MFSGLFDDNTCTSDGGIRPARLCPAYLQANATSHTWVFSAIAELVDNAYDPDVDATKLWITRRNIAGHTCLVFTDNGSGMTREKIHRMLSFGYSEKEDGHGRRAVGQYGNGFKSGSMRLGKDVIVFTKRFDSKSVGMLSQTYLENSRSQTVQLPIVTWDSNDKMKATHFKALEAITGQGLFNSSRELLEQFASFSDEPSGTQIIIYNLKKDSHNRLELDFESDHTDILYSEHVIMDQVDPLQPRDTVEHKPLFRRSLKEYLSILYLKPKMQIHLRQKRIRTKILMRELSNIAVDIYKPRSLGLNKRVEITFGQLNSHDDCGIMLYYKNRLIKGFEKVGILRKRNDAEGLGVVGIVDVDFFEPIQNKQDFIKTDQYTTALTRIGQKLSEYWREKIEGKPACKSVHREQMDNWLWVLCDGCRKWRRLQCDLNAQLPEQWYCHMNADPSYNRCEDAEEQVASLEVDEITTPYTKTRGAQMRKEKRERGKMQQEMRSFAGFATPDNSLPVHTPSDGNAIDHRSATKRSLPADVNQTPSPSKIGRTRTAFQQVSSFTTTEDIIEHSFGSADDVQPGPSHVAQETLPVSETRAPSSVQLQRTPAGSDKMTPSRVVVAIPANASHSTTGLRNLEQNLRSSQLRKEDLWRLLQEKEKEVSSAVDVNLGLQLELDRLTEENKDRTRLENELSSAKAEIHNLQGKVKTLEDELSAARHEAIKREEKLDELEKNRLKIRNLTQELSNIKNVLQKQLDEATERIDQYKIELNAQEKLHADLKHALTGAMKAVSKAEQNSAWRKSSRT